MPDQRPSSLESDFAALFEAHHARVLAYTLRRSEDAADAEDAAAETFIIAWRRRGDVPPDALPWLYGVARRVMANQRRSTLRRVRALLRLDPDRPQAVSIGEETGPATAALARLSPDDQEILRLVAWEELAHAQIATVLGISTNAVAIRLHRARRRFAVAYADLAADVKGPDRDRTSRSVKGKLTGQAHEDSR